MLLNDEINLLSGVQVVLRNRLTARPPQEYNSRDDNGSGQFVEYRPFTRGESARYIDWRRFLRDKSLVTRKNESLEQPEVALVVDLSRSVVAGNKADAIRRIAAMLGFCLLNRGLALRLYNGREYTGRYFGKKKIQQLTAKIKALPQNGYSHLEYVLATAAPVRNVIIISDLLFSGGPEQLKACIKPGMADCSLLAVSTQEERQPQLHGNYKLIDAQNGTARQYYINDQLIARYARLRLDYFRQIQQYCQGRNWNYFQLEAEAQISQLMKLLAPTQHLTI